MARLFRGVIKFKWLEVVSGGTMRMGASGSPVTLTAGTPVTGIYTTCSSTSGSTSAEPFLVHTTMTGAGGVGGRGKFYMTTNVALGGWSNALKSEVVYGASGRTTGLGTVHCAELTLSAGTSAGTYGIYEAELNMGTSAVLGSGCSIIYASVQGAGIAAFDTGGYFLTLTGVTSNSGKVFYANKSVPFDAYLRIKVNTTDYFIGLLAQQAAAT